MTEKNSSQPVITGTQENGRIVFAPELASYLIAALAVPLVLHFHLLPTVFAGLAVHVLTVKLARRLPVRWGGMSHKFSLAAIVIVVVLGLFAVGLGLWSFLRGAHGMAALLAIVAETLENVRRTLPPDIAEYIPTTIEDVRWQITCILRDHSRHVSAAGMAGVRTLVHVLFGMVIGGMTALHHFDPNDSWSPFVAALYARTGALADAFEKIVFAQVKISALNTVFSALYLMVVLPVFGIHLPMVQVLVPLTFVAGLLPVVGNLISNTAIVLISLGVSPGVAVASLIFLVFIHKLEYFLNARIIGGEVQARAWELLCAMLVMESVFGIAGLIAAPVGYAWIKEELRNKNVI
ncbi:MAG: AI-2E family transporter [Desulfomonilaceae bacterium]